jgi:transposase
LEATDEAALRRMDRRRSKKGSNAVWINPHDPEAQITRMKDGRTALAYKAEHAVDMDTGAIVAVTAHGGAASANWPQRGGPPASQITSRRRRRFL